MDLVNKELPQYGTQQHILSATLMLFSEKGYFNTSVRDIARESGQSIGSIYHHFKDKEGVASAVYRNLLEIFGVRVKTISYYSAHWFLL